ncbi:branched-chain amino acid ABC transporter permease [Natronocalculus amylovorans]|uniref:Branched-chain amino acid ABC transporter permease n=1 Tax=Natronocalculus amylovorans TaxID=2917812 RepID=A0AAE3K9B8_9EURY|nr:branched-chain amino acid ABC transporter permease [Natronocalculus amylovorans]MCL9817405.1 branched-chain amino acid ABC transporter permease [Natronocalculus amylovorans]NUE02569.1 branched-chain amino acid ABC transporter permease [Halorubraceae archaeon YAN]
MSSDTANRFDREQIRQTLDEEPLNLGVTIGDVSSFIGLIVMFLLLVGTGVLSFNYGLYLLGLIGMYGFMVVGLNIQWGYAGLINFSVIAFWGIGAYSAALLTSPGSPHDLMLSPLIALVVAIIASALVAVLIGIPTLRLRADYLAIASLGLAEVIRLILLNEREWTAGSRGISGSPELFAWIPAEPLIRLFSESASVRTGRNAIVIIGMLFIGYLFVRRIHRSPWGRAMRTIRGDEDLAKALGKDTYRLKMQAFVIGCIFMAVAGWFYVYAFQYLDPGELEPLQTFYVWVALILGGTGSDRGSLVGAVTIVAILEGTRFLNEIGTIVFIFETIPFIDLNVSAVRLLLVGILIILVVRFRPQGILPPKEELIWPGAAPERSAERQATREQREVEQ